MDETRIQISESADLQNRVASAMAEMRELKQQQYIGSDSVRFYKKDSGLPYDWSGVPPQSPQAAYVSTKILRVKASALTQNVLFADLIAEMRKDSNSNPRYTILDYIDAIYFNQNYFSIFKYADPQEVGKENEQSWTVVLNGGDPNGVSRPLNTLFMKAYVVANDEVTITVTELN
jgi:hypothetical protein